MTGATDPAPGTSASGTSKGSARGAVPAVTIALAGIVLTGLIAGHLLAPAGPAPLTGNGMEISTVAAADLQAAEGTLAPDSRAALDADAKSCKAPLAVMTLTRQPGAAGGTIRVRSGAYLSPAFRVTDVAQRIAIPFPTPYATGAGTLSVEGAATGVQLTLYPTWTAAQLSGAGVINLIWRTDKPCGS